MRVRIFGPLEARLQPVDRLVLGGLVEGVWPPETRADPWLSRPMRHELGLDLPERRIGLSAHDFAQALGAPEVILTRAAKLGGAPTVASRFVQRLAAVAGEARWHGRAGARRALSSSWRARSTRRPQRAAADRAARSPSRRATRGRSRYRSPRSSCGCAIPIRSTPGMSCGLRPLDAVDTPPGARDRGTVIHGAIGDFTAQFKDKLPDDIVGELLRLGERAFCRARGLSRRAGVLVAALPAHRALVRGFRDRRRGGIVQLDAEIHGTLEIPLRRARLHAARARRPHRASRRRPLRHPRLQDRPGADRAAGQVRAGAAAHARRRDPARRTLRRRSRRAPRSPSSSMSRCAASIRPASRSRSPGRTDAGRRGRQGAAPPDRLIAEVRRPRHALPLARAADVHAPRTGATTITWRGSGNGRCPAARPTMTRASGE